jgi:hypothetical protein
VRSRLSGSPDDDILIDRIGDGEIADDLAQKLQLVSSRKGENGA